MHSKKITKKYVAFLRGINVGGHHKVPMLELKKEFEKLGFKNIITLLNSGNILFDTVSSDIEKLEETVAIHLEKYFDFPIPTIIRKSEMIIELLHNKPFKTIKVTKDIRLYVSFLKENREPHLKLPWISSDNSYQILDYNDKTIYSVLDLSLSKTPKAMKVIEQFYGKNITTRNWNTIERIEKKLNTNNK